MIVELLIECCYGCKEIVFYGLSPGRYTIGYIPRADNETIASILEMGWTDIFECRISRINETTHPENQVHLTIKIKRNKTESK